MFCPGQLKFDKWITIGWRVSPTIKTTTNCGWFNAVVSFTQLSSFGFGFKDILWRKTYYHHHRLDLDLQTQSGYWGSPSPAALRCKKDDGFDPWSHFLTRLRCQITFWPRKHFWVTPATSYLVRIDRSILFLLCVFYFEWQTCSISMCDKLEENNG